MAVLNRKLGRDLLGSAGLLATVVTIIAVGTSAFIAMGSAYRILSASQHAYYETYRFADFWVDVKKAPLTAVEPIARLPGVAAVETRVAFDVILDVPGVVEPITGRLLSVPARGFDRTINGVHLVRGSGFSDDRDEEVIIGEAFANAHHLGPGDRIALILNRKREVYVIVGTAISPEYVYMVRGEGDFLPDPKHFGILYIKEAYAREVLDFQDACNQIVGRLVPGHEGEVETILREIDRRLDAYGVLATTPRARQASNRFLSDEIHGLEITSVFMPAIFLGVAALILNIVMSRLAVRQRAIIGTLKALGYSDRQVLVHYLSFGLAIGLLGGLMGIGLGLVFTYGMVELYKTIFQFPRFIWQVHPDLFLIGLAISLTFAVVGTTKGVWRVLRLRPAEAMRPPPPERGGAVFLERFPAMWRPLGFRTHIALRSLARNRGRTASGAIASALATAIILMALIMYDSFAFLVEFQFDRVTHADVTVGMRDERGRRALYEAAALPGVDYAEPMLGLTCDVRHGRYARRLVVSGLSPGHRLLTPMTADLRPIDIPPEGLVLSRKLAQILRVDVGDTLAVTPVRGRRETVHVPVLSTVDSFLGLECYADIRYLSRIVGESFAVNSVEASVAPAQARELFRSLKTLPNAQGVSVLANTKANIQTQLIDTMHISIGIMIAFAGVIAFGSMLNASLIEIADRVRDVSTFRLLGYRPWQIAAIFFRQNAVVFLLGLALSGPIGYGMTVGMSSAYDTELFRMPIVVRWPSIVGAAGAAFVFVVVAQWFVYRQIVRLDWRQGVSVKE
jgi:putative ABC transport system permease protein